jgi:YHS domain-containing protein
MKYTPFAFAFVLLSFSPKPLRAADSPAYPLQICVVSGEKLGSMGKAFVHSHEGREVQFCCKGCLKDFNKDPQKYLKKIDEATEKAKK